MRFFSLAGILVLLTCCHIHASDRYYATFYGAQDARNTPSRSHTFACFVKASFDDSQPSNDAPRLLAVESIAISWLPADGTVRLFGGPAIGHNQGFAEALNWARSHGLQVSSYGPYEIRKDIFDAAEQQATRLRSGGVLYKALDNGYRPRLATNCIHSVADIVPGTLLHTGTSRGNSATQKVVAHFQPFLIDPQQTHAWVIPYFGRTERFDVNSPQPAVKVARR